MVAAKVEAGQQLQAELDKWALTTDGKSFKDIKTLLSTVHDVFWQNSNWTPISLSDLMINPAEKSKKFYRKAILLCHPDKHQHAPADQQYRAERIFSALNEAFKV